jgi:hypothetical protein
MITTNAVDDEKLWNEFHRRVVNMTSTKSAEWLSSPRCILTPTTTLLRQRRARLGQQVLQILSKRPSDLTSEELQVMRELSRG